MKLWSTLNNFAAHPFVLLVIRGVIGGIFLLFGISKALAPHASFYQSVRDYQLLPESVIPIFATAVVAVEIIAGLFLIVGIFTRTAAQSITALLVLFLIAITQAQARGIYLADCGCSSGLIQLGDSPQQVLIRDGIMLLAMLWFCLKNKNRWTLDRLLER